MTLECWGPCDWRTGIPGGQQSSGSNGRCPHQSCNRDFVVTRKNVRDTVGAAGLGFQGLLEESLSINYFHDLYSL